MLCVDVNVIVSVINTDSPHHDTVRGWLDSTLMSTEPLLVPDFVATSFIRIVTDRRILPRPATVDQAFAVLDALLSSPHVLLVHPSATTWTRFREITVLLGLTANDVPDALLAAMASDLDATLVTADRGFRRFPGLKVLDPTVRVP